jgi:hypothetical protein
MPDCRTQERGTARVCTGLKKGHEGDHNFVAPEGATDKQKYNRGSREFIVASMLAAILDEPQDNPDDPGAVRVAQARELLSWWSSSNIVTPLWTILNLKQGYCVRCEDDPCPKCGRDAAKETVPWTVR